MGDAISYSGRAQLIAAGQWFRPSFVAPPSDHGPLTPLVLAPAAWIDGGQATLRGAMACIGGAAVVAIGLVGRKIGGDRVGLLAAGIAAVYPNLWMNDGVVMSETLTALLSALVVLGALELADRSTAPIAALTGLAAGLAILTRSELALLLPFVVAPVLIRRHSRRWLLLGATVLIAAVAVAPWAIWNLTHYSKPVLLSTTEGRTLRGANCDETWYGSLAGLWSLSEDCLPPVDGDPSVQSSTYRRMALDQIGARPTWVPVVVAIRELRVWSVYEPGVMAHYNRGEDRPVAASWAGTAMYWMLLPFAAVGLWSARRRGIAVAPLVGTFAVVATTAAAFYGLVRFRVPAEVALVVLGSAGLDVVARRLGASQPPPPGVSPGAGDDASVSCSSSGHETS